MLPLKPRERLAVRDSWVMSRLAMMYFTPTLTPLIKIVFFALEALVIPVDKIQVFVENKSVLSQSF